MDYDLLTIGSGTAAMVAAFRVASVGWSVAVVDEKPFGGTCALRGCDPKKMLVAGAEVLHREEVLICDEMLLPRNAEPHGLGSRGDEDVPCAQALARDGYGVRSHKPCWPVEGGDPLLMIALLVLRRDRIGEAPLEGDEIAPLDADLGPG